ncbi:MAG: DUF423 domain-containing protein [Pirellulaceae bacterium]|jgi:uncharacterized membrane protein YgdD (TMEM256/DUF423 family)|nr:DUF423 domain-containing protein [Pirellulaceae bacterium]
MNGKHILVLASLLGASGVAMGAYQAHGLEKMLSQRGVDPVDAQRRIENCEVAVRYQMYHAIALIGIGVGVERLHRRLLAATVSFLTLGVCAFSGGLYEIVFRGQATHFAIVPLGGLMLIVGWIFLGIAALAKKD